MLTEQESQLLTGIDSLKINWLLYCFFLTSKFLTITISMLDYVYHTLAAKASGELCLKYVFAFGAFARLPLLHRFVGPSFNVVS